MAEFKTSQGNGNERQPSTVSISPSDLRAFNKIKSYILFHGKGTSITSEFVMSNLIQNWYKVNDSN